MKLGMSETLTKALNADTREQAIQILQQNYSIPFSQMLKMAFDPYLVWDLPEQDPPYRISELTDTQGMLFSEAKRMYLFHKGARPDLSDAKRQTLFVQMLECLDKEDAEFVLAVRNKNVPDVYPGIDQELVNEAFPGLLTY